jgi:hypothetical protein
MMEDQSDMKMDNDSTTDALLSINSLKYTLPEQLSVVTARSIQKVLGSLMGVTRGFDSN